MAGFCIHCGKKLEDGQTCNCQTISSQQLQGQSPVKEQEAVPMASNHTAETGKGIQINIDQEMVDKLVNGTINNVGNGAVLLMILPSLSGICIIAGVLLSIILGSYSLVSQMQVNKNQSMYIATGVYTLQVILVFYVIKAVAGM